MPYGQHSYAENSGKRWKVKDQLSDVWDRVRRYQRVGHNRVLWEDGGGNIRYRLHRTDLVIWWANGAVTVTTGGFETLTTRKAIMEALPGFTAYGHRGNTLLRHPATGAEWLLSVLTPYGPGKSFKPSEVITFGMQCKGFSNPKEAA